MQTHPHLDATALTKSSPNQPHSHQTIHPITLCSIQLRLSVVMLVNTMHAPRSIH